MKIYLILLSMLVFHTAKAQDVEYQSPETPTIKKSDGVTNYNSLAPSQPSTNKQYKSNGWGGAGTLSPRGVIDEWEEYRSN